MRPDILRIPVGPGAIHVERYGHGGTPFVLLHGFGTCAFLWRAVAPALAHAGHTAYAIDLFGHGESDRTIGADFGSPAQAEYIDAAMTGLRIARAVVVGNDLGGEVALRLALQRPDRVEALALINTPAFDESPARDITTMQRSTARFAFKLGEGILAAAPLLKTVLKGSVASPDRMPDRLVARYLAPFADSNGVNHLLTLAAAAAGSAKMASIGGESTAGSGAGAIELDEHLLGAIEVPTLVIRGDADAWLLKRTAEQLARAIPRARLVTIADAGRLLPEEAPDELTDHLRTLIIPQQQGRGPTKIAAK